MGAGGDAVVEDAGSDLGDDWAGVGRAGDRARGGIGSRAEEERPGVRGGEVEHFGDSDEHGGEWVDDVRGHDGARDFYACGGDDGARGDDGTTGDDPTARDDPIARDDPTARDDERDFHHGVVFNLLHHNLLNLYRAPFHHISHS